MKPACSRSETSCRIFRGIHDIMILRGDLSIDMIAAIRSAKVDAFVSTPRGCLENGYLLRFAALDCNLIPILNKYQSTNYPSTGDLNRENE
jgi:hypothetical protein